MCLYRCYDGAMGITTAEPQTEKVAVSDRTSAPIRSRWVDLFLSSDPGLARLRHAIQSVLTIALLLEAERLFVQITGAMQIRTGAGASTAKVAEVTVAN